MNRICLTGRVIADPELRTLGERVVATVPVAVNRPYKRKDAPYPDSDVFRVDVWGARGESLVNHVSKGAHIWVTGRVELRKAEGSGYYVDVRDGEWGFAGVRPGATEMEPEFDDPDTGGPDSGEPEPSEPEFAPVAKAPARSGKKSPAGV